MIRIAICDDDEMDRSMLEEKCKRYINEHSAELDLKVYSSGKKLMADNYAMNILLLDKEMPGVNGIKIKEQFIEQGRKVYIIFVTGYELVAEMVGTNVSGYLKKPVEYAALCREIDKILRIQKQDERMVMVRGVKEDKPIRIQDIMYVESHKPYVVLYLIDGTSVSDRKSLVQFESEVEDIIVRAGRKYLINLEHIEEIYKDVLLDNGKHIKISKEAKAELKKKRNNYISNKKRKQWR